MKLVLGTAQFGLDYGITNKSGRVNDETIRKILFCAAECGIDMLDTAHAYGISEVILGQRLSAGNSFKIITKTQPLASQQITAASVQQVRKSVELSYQKLQQDTLYGVLIHHASELLMSQGEDIYAVLSDLKQKKRVTKIGVSVYSPEMAEQIMNKYPIDLIQFPLNLLDQRMVRSGILKKLKHKGIEIHVRSPFLQGVLLADIDALPAKFNAIQHQLAFLETLANRLKSSKMSLALGYLKKFPDIDKIVVGVVNDQQLTECVNAFKEDISEEIDDELLECQDLSIIDPSKW